MARYRDDLYTYRQLRRIYLSQRAFWLINDRSHDPQAARRSRQDRIRQFLGMRRQYARSLTNGRYDQYGCTIR